MVVGIETWSAGDMFGEALRVERILGRGGAGTVYLATDTWLGRKVAVKVLSGPLAHDPRMLERFKREARALARVRSDHIARAYAMGSHVFGPQPETNGETEGISILESPLRSSDTCWIAMEYVEGASLGTIIEMHRAHKARVPIHRAIAILRQIALGLSAVHKCQLVHRDVKPFNVVIEEHTGRPVLVDFGLVADDGEVSEDQPYGTAAYMPPEQSGFGQGDTHLTKQADIYALGCTAFELLTGRVPFSGSTPLEVLLKHALEEAPRLSTGRPDLEPLDAVIARMLDKDPAGRYASCDALIASFDAVLKAFDDRPTLPPPPMSRPSSRTLDDDVRILVVDDDPAFRRLAVGVVRAHLDELHEAGALEARVELVEAESGEEALTIAAELRPDVVLLDFDMPGLDGIATLTRLRQLPRADSARVVVISSRVTEQERWRFTILGVTDFLPKPIAPEILAKKVVQLLGAEAARPVS